MSPYVANEPTCAPPSLAPTCTSGWARSGAGGVDAEQLDGVAAEDPPLRRRASAPGSRTAPRNAGVISKARKAAIWSCGEPYQMQSVAPQDALRSERDEQLAEHVAASSGLPIMVAPVEPSSA